MSRGLGETERFVVVRLAVADRRPRLVTDLARDWAHERLSLRHPERDLPERCSCRGACSVLLEYQAQSVRRAVRHLESEGIVATRLDPWQRKLAWLAAVEWHPHRDVDDAGPALCQRCGVRLAGEALRGVA